MNQYKQLQSESGRLSTQNTLDFTARSEANKPILVRKSLRPVTVDMKLNIP